MKFQSSRVRLLPAVMLVGAALLGFKGRSLVMTAWAQEQQAPSSAATAVLAKDTAPVPQDPAIDTSEGSTAAEVDVLSSLAKRRAALDARQADLNMRAQVLAATEARIDAKIATLKQLQTQLATLLGQRDTQQKQQIASLVKTYSAMRPRDAARIFDTLSDDVLIPVAQQMKSDALAPILAAMNSQAAESLTEKLAGHQPLPDVAAIAAANNMTAAAVPAGAAPAPAAAPGSPSPAVPPASQNQAAGR